MEKIRNKNILKRGGYAVALIAIVIAGAILFNYLIGLLAKRVELEYDLTPQKINSISKENKEYLKKVNKDVDIYVIAPSANDYVSYMNAYYEQVGYISETSDYYNQTVKALELYDSISKKISVTYLDPWGVEMSKLTTEYSENFNYGDIFVVSKFKNKDGVELNNHKLLTITDIYNYSDPSGFASMGMGSYYVSSSRLETALTSAISFVTSEDTKKIAFLSGHGGSDTYGYYKELLELNNFLVEEVEDKIITSLSDEYDGIVICAPVNDFSGKELDVINDYLDNGGKKGKTLLFFGDTTYQNLPNLYDFLDEWGITVEQGIVFETDDRYHFDKDYSTFVSGAATSESEIVKSNHMFISGYNIPMKENGNPYGGRETTTLLCTNGTSVCGPVGTPKEWKPTSDYKKTQYATLIMAKEANFYEEKAVYSYVLAFSSVDFISENYVTSFSSFGDYRGMVLRAMKVPTGMNDDSGIVFDDKQIESFNARYITTQKSSKTMLIIFVAVIPLCLLAFATFILIRRKNL